MVIIPALKKQQIYLGQKSTKKIRSKKIHQDHSDGIIINHEGRYGFYKTRVIMHKIPWKMKIHLPLLIEKEKKLGGGEHL